MRKLVPDAIEHASLYPPGRPLEEAQRELGLDRIIKLNANENCYGPSPKAVREVKNAAGSVHRYPDNSAYYLRNKLSHMMKVGTDQIIFGNG